jgi:hypothetical protein
MASTLYLRVCSCGKIWHCGENWIELDRTMTEFFKEVAKDGVTEIQIILMTCTECEKDNPREVTPQTARKVTLGW